MSISLNALFCIAVNYFQQLWWLSLEMEITKTTFENTVNYVFNDGFLFPPFYWNIFNLFPQPSAKKLLIASEVRRVFEDNNIVAVFQYGDMTTVEWDNLRFELRKQHVHVKVFPNKVACKALEGTIYKEISPLFLSTTCVVYSNKQTVKYMLGIIRKQPKMELMGAKIDNRLMSRYAVIEYSKLPSLEEQYFSLVHYLSSTASRLSALLCRNQQQLVSSLSRHANPEQEDSNQIH